MTQKYLPCSCCSVGGLCDEPCASTQEIAALVGALLDIEHTMVTGEDAHGVHGDVLAIVERHLGHPSERPYPARRTGEPAYADPEILDTLLRPTPRPDKSEEKPK